MWGEDVGVDGDNSRGSRSRLYVDDTAEPVQVQESMGMGNLRPGYKARKEELVRHLCSPFHMHRQD